MTKTEVVCVICQTNAARYIDQLGRLTCGVCPVLKKLDSIRVSDIPRLLEWSRTYLAGFDPEQMPSWVSELQALVGRGPRKAGP